MDPNIQFGKRAGCSLSDTQIDLLLSLGLSLLDCAFIQS